jgi:hypothetical protein
VAVAKAVGVTLTVADGEADDVADAEADGDTVCVPVRVDVAAGVGMGDSIMSGEAKEFVFLSLNTPKYKPTPIAPAIRMHATTTNDQHFFLERLMTESG